MTVYGNNIILISGQSRQGDDIVNTIQLLLQGDENIPDIPTARMGASAVSFDNCLVVAGGYIGGKNPVKDIEVYKEDMWSKLEHNFQVSAIMKVMSHENHVYLLGSNEHEKNIVLTVEKLKLFGSSPLSAHLSEPLPYKQSCVTIFEGKVLAMGGMATNPITGFDEVTSEIRYYSNERWISYAIAMPISLCKSTALTLSSGKIMVIGGENKKKKISGAMYIHQGST